MTLPALLRRTALAALAVVAMAAAAAAQTSAARWFPLEKGNEWTFVQVGTPDPARAETRTIRCLQERGAFRLVSGLTGDDRAATWVAYDGFMTDHLWIYDAAARRWATLFRFDGAGSGSGTGTGAAPVTSEPSFPRYGVPEAPLGGVAWLRFSDRQGPVELCDRGATFALAAARIGAHPPAAPRIGDRSAIEGEEAVIEAGPVPGTAAPACFSLLDPPVGATIDAATGRFSWPTFPGHAGEHRVTFWVTDGASASAETIALTVVSPVTWRDGLPAGAFELRRRVELPRVTEVAVRLRGDGAGRITIHMGDHDAGAEVAADGSFQLVSSGYTYAGHVGAGRVFIRAAGWHGGNELARPVAVEMK